MINLYQEPKHKVFEPDAFYAYTSVIHNDLYLLGTQYLINNELKRAHVDIEHGQIKLPNEVFFKDFEQAADAFLTLRYPEKIYQYGRLLSKAVLKLDRAVDTQQVGQYFERVTALRDALSRVMSTANFFSMYVDVQNTYHDQLSDELAGHLTAREVGDLLTQPVISPFLKVLKLSGLKHGAGRYGIYQFINRVYFLRGFDLNVGWEKLKDIDVFLQQLGCNEGPSITQTKYLKEQKEEWARQTRVRELRARAYQHVSKPDVLALALAAVDAEELRHYWQARALHVLAKLMEYLQLNPSSTSFDEVLNKLRGFQ
ncbi:hypothetical protein [Pseudoalteromonas viridis]|uniref:Uncharacterized protein n=1 Tax=Pseudoalteromonas viridis TaxID=339617 RepID=A0ABX7V6D8_9GAMM|nr:hypothetical protein [Pseudoalteromonas viridis]QTL36458.1 hypothetical protein J5X90_05265 [Pseudoalteromonas viridis]